jgi:hypothetical protein
MPDGENLTVSPSRHIYHCFSCGLGGPLPDVTDLDQVCGKRPPETILVQVPSHAEAVAYREKTEAQFMLLVQRQLLKVLPPHILPFWEMGELVEMSLTRWHIHFPADAAIARKRIEQHGGTIVQEIKKLRGAPVELVIS